MLTLENIINNPFGSAFHPYAAPFGEGTLGIFFAITLVAVPTLIVAMKTKHPTPPVVTIIISSSVAAGLVGQWAGYLIIFAGIMFGVLIYLLARGVRRR